MSTLFEVIGGVIVTTLCFVLLYISFVLLPVSMYATSECLAKGFPKAHVTYKLDRYCSNLDGSVTVKVVQSH